MYRFIEAVNIHLDFISIQHNLQCFLKTMEISSLRNIQDTRTKRGVAGSTKKERYINVFKKEKPKSTARGRIYRNDPMMRGK